MDKEKLEYERKIRNVSVEELCNAANISRSAYYRKCNGTSEFTRREMIAICNRLSLASPMGIFFPEFVS